MVMDFYPWDVRCDVPTVLEGSSHDAVTAEFRYCVEEPYAVTAVFTAKDVEVEWTFARDLLSEGLAGSVGEGDVLVSPGLPGRVRMLLRSPEGAASLLCDRHAVERFLSESFRAVPAGGEAARLDIDELIDALTG